MGELYKSSIVLNLKGTSLIWQNLPGRCQTSSLEIFENGGAGGLQDGTPEIGILGGLLANTSIKVV